MTPSPDSVSSNSRVVDPQQVKAEEMLKLLGELNTPSAVDATENSETVDDSIDVHDVLLNSAAE